VTDEVTPPSQEGMLESLREKRARIRYLTRPGILASAVLVLLVASATIAGSVRPSETHPRPPSIKDQTSRLRSELAAKGFQSTTWSVQLHPGSTPSLLTVAKPTVATRLKDPDVSDQLFIYDEDDSGRLNQAFSFRPVAVRLTDAGPLPGSAHAESFAFPFDESRPITHESAEPSDMLQVVRVDGTNGTDGEQILGAVAEYGDGQDVFPRPFEIAWDTAAHNYVLQALLSPQTTSLNTMANTVTQPTGGRNDYARLLWENVYLNPVEIRNEGTSQVLQAYAPQTYVLTQLLPNPSLDDPSGSLRLRAAYAVSSPSPGTIGNIEVIDWALVMRPNGGPITAAPYPVRKRLPVGANSSRLEQVLQGLQ
jgi:hypothetical protein